MHLPQTFPEGENTIFAVIETPAGNRNKYVYDSENDYFKLKKVLPAGTSFPLDFGFIPHTKGEDGDPLDVLVIMDLPAFPGCVVECRVIGVLEAEQKEKEQKKIRNDRIVAVAAASIQHADLEALDNIDKHLLNDVIHFFKYYNAMEGKKFKLLRKGSRKSALALIKKHML